MDDRGNELRFTRSMGSLFEVPSDMLLNPVNCKGVSGAGLALEFKRRFPVSQKRYEEACMFVTERKFRPGDILHFVEIIGDGVFQSIVFFPTKNHWKDPSKYEYVSSGLRSLSNLLRREEFSEVKRVSIPALGCGLGGLDWFTVEGMIKEILGDIDKTFILFPPK